jgi:preprotein translocase subunit SecD
MLQFTRAQAAIILVTVLLICGCTLPNFVSPETLAGWPDWAQRRIALQPELQGGTSLLLEVDHNDVREQVLTSVLQDVRSVLHDARINLAKRATIRGGSVEVRPRGDDFEAALAELRDLSRAFNGVRPVEVTDAGGGLIRVTPTEAGVHEYEPPATDHSIEVIRARARQIGVGETVEHEGAGRIRVQVPGEVFSRVTR